MTQKDRLRKLKAKDFYANMITANVVDARRIHNLYELREVTYVAIGLGLKGAN
jgi:hypothetical protein